MFNFPSCFRVKMKKTFLLLMLLFSTYTSAQNFPAPYINPSNIVWSSNSLPSDIKSSSDFLKWSKETGQESASRWGYLSLLDETNSQVIIEGASPSAGGLDFLVLTKSAKGWKKLIDIHGGFIFYPVPSKRHTLVVYSKSGLEYYRTEFLLSNGKYIQKSTYEVPIELTRLEGSSIDFYKYFWVMNGKEAKGK
jgi:hypothetical protein